MEMEFEIPFHDMFGRQIKFYHIFSNSMLGGFHHSLRGWKEFISILGFLFKDQNNLKMVNNNIQNCNLAEADAYIYKLFIEAGT